jgi:hypothetical protein
MLPADQVARRTTAKVLTPGAPGAARRSLDPVFLHPSRPGSGMDPRNPACPRLVVATGFEHLFDTFHRAQADEEIPSGRNGRRGICLRCVRRPRGQQSWRRQCTVRSPPAAARTRGCATWPSSAGPEPVPFRRAIALCSTAANTYQPGSRIQATDHRRHTHPATTMEGRVSEYCNEHQRKA